MCRMPPRSPCMRRDIISRNRSRWDDRCRKPGRRTAVPQSFPCRDVEVHFATREVGDIADADAGRLAEFVFASVAVAAGASPVRRRRRNTFGSQSDSRERQRQKPQGAHAFHANRIAQFRSNPKRRMPADCSAGILRNERHKAPVEFLGGSAFVDRLKRSTLCCPYLRMENRYALFLELLSLRA